MCPSHNHRSYPERRPASVWCHHPQPFIDSQSHLLLNSFTLYCLNHGDFWGLSLSSVCLIPRCRTQTSFLTNFLPISCKSVDAWTLAHRICLPWMWSLTDTAVWTWPALGSSTRRTARWPPSLRNGPWSDCRLRPNLTLVYWTASWPWVPRLLPAAPVNLWRMSSHLCHIRWNTRKHMWSCPEGNRCVKWPESWVLWRQHLLYLWLVGKKKGKGFS